MSRLDRERARLGVTRFGRGRPQACVACGATPCPHRGLWCAACRPVGLSAFWASTGPMPTLATLARLVRERRGLPCCPHFHPAGPCPEVITVREKRTACLCSAEVIDDAA